jgi:hypothetical protein
MSGSEGSISIADVELRGMCSDSDIIPAFFTVEIHQFQSQPEHGISVGTTDN